MRVVCLRAIRNEEGGGSGVDMNKVCVYVAEEGACGLATGAHNNMLNVRKDSSIPKSYSAKNGLAVSCGEIRRGVEGSDIWDTFCI